MTIRHVPVQLGDEAHLYAEWSDAQSKQRQVHGARKPGCK